MCEFGSERYTTRSHPMLQEEENLLATVESLLDRVKEIAPILRAHAEEAEKARRLSRPVVDAMLKAGLYSMSRPKSSGGLGLDTVTMSRVVEEVASMDSASSLNLQLSVAAHFLLAWLPEKATAEILEGERETILGGSFTPKGQAIPVEGGYRVTGQWPFVSGAHDCSWFSFSPFIMDGDRPATTTKGSPSGVSRGFQRQTPPSSIPGLPRYVRHRQPRCRCLRPLRAGAAHCGLGPPGAAR